MALGGKRHEVDECQYQSGQCDMTVSHMQSSLLPLLSVPAYATACTPTVCVRIILT